MQCVRGDGRVYKNFTTLFKKFLRNGKFAVVLFSAVACHGNGSPILMPAQGNDGSESVP